MHCSTIDCSGDHLRRFSKLCSCSPNWLRIALPAAEISAPESGSVSTSAAPFSDEIWTLIVGARPVASPSFAWLICGGSFAVAVSAWIDLVGVCGCGVLSDGPGCASLALQTLAKWPTRLHRWHVRLYAWHRLRPP